MFDNQERVYANCKGCDVIHVMVKTWRGGTPKGAIRCDCGADLPFTVFRHAYTGARWAQRWYDDMRALQAVTDELVNDPLR